MKKAIVLLTLLGAIPALSLAFAPAPLPRPETSRRVEVGKNVTLEVRGGKFPRRRVIVAASVCLREGILEHLLTRRMGKEHEAILAADVDARDVHVALLLAGAVPGKPAQTGPKFVGARGQVIRIGLQWKDKGETRYAPAQDWVREIETKKAMTHDWVFAGSQLVSDPQQQDRKYYLANQGDVFCVANFEAALLDLPVKSPASSAEGLLYEAFTERIPPLGTAVSVILEPGPAGKD